MESLFLLIPLSVLLIIGVSWIFLRMVSQGQFDDLDSPAQSILLDDDRARITPEAARTGAGAAAVTDEKTATAHTTANAEPGRAGPPRTSAGN